MINEEIRRKTEVVQDIIEQSGRKISNITLAIDMDGDLFDSEQIWASDDEGEQA